MRDAAPLTLAEIEAEVRRRAATVGAGEDGLPTYGRTEDFARPHVEVDGRGYHYVVVERGRELRRDTTRALDELLSWIFGDVTFSLASRYEVANRVAGVDTRRLLFARQEELLAMLSPAWSERMRQRHAAILRDHPFVDD
jgi:Immunity protein 63